MLQCFSCSVYTEIHNILLLYSALTVALSTESKVVVSDMGRVFHIWTVILNENSWMIMLSRALWDRVSCADLSLYRQAERINSLQRFWNRWNKPFLKPNINLLDTSWGISRRWQIKKYFLFAVILCLSLSLWLLANLSAYSKALYVCTHFSWCCVNVKSSKAGAWKPKLLNVLLVIAWSFISGCQERAALQGKFGFGRQICKI